MAESIAFLVERLKAEAEKTAAAFALLTESQWSLPVYTEGEEPDAPDTTWTARSILAHFVSSERELLKLFKDIRDGGFGAGEDFDIDRYNASQQRKLAELSVAELLEQFGAARSETAAFVSGLKEADLERQGRHPYLGVTTLDEMIKMVYRHNQLHYRDLRQALSAQPAVAPDRQVPEPPPGANS